MSRRSRNARTALVCAALLGACSAPEAVPAVAPDAPALPPRGNVPPPAAELRRLAHTPPPAAPIDLPAPIAADLARDAPAPAEALARQDPRAPTVRESGPGPAVVPDGPLPAAELLRRQQLAQVPQAAPAPVPRE